MKRYTSVTPSVFFAPTLAESIQGFLRVVRVPNGTIIRQTDLGGKGKRGKADMDIQILDNEKGKVMRM